MNKKYTCIDCHKTWTKRTWEIWDTPRGIMCEKCVGKELISRKRQSYYNHNKEKFSTYNKTYYQNNKDKLKTYYKKYYLDHKGKK